MIVNALSLFFSLIILRRFEKFAQINPFSYILPFTLSVYGIFVTILLSLRFEYSIKIIVIGVFMTIVFLLVQYNISRRRRNFTLAVVPLGDALLFESDHHYKFKMLTSPLIPDFSNDGILADMHSECLTSDWEKFLTNCALNKIPVYNSIEVREAMTGMVNVKHLIANNSGNLLPSTSILFFKRVIDTFILILMLPIIIPVIITIMICIVIDSPGGPFFVQDRMGMGGKWFKMIKFRSMYIDKKGNHYTEEGYDHRITKVGKFIRKFRLDELPQFWNVFKGDMSLIGPRPESKALAKSYDKEVPFFAYRHVVRPGISGWAQVMHGYTSGVDNMKDKLSYDFYYIKNFSLWLDILIWYKTIVTVLTGFGSR